MKIRAKFVVQQHETAVYASHSSKKLIAIAVGDDTPENQKFSVATPCGELELSCVRDEVFQHFKPGDEIYLDITKAVTPT